MALQNQPPGLSASNVPLRGFAIRLVWSLVFAALVFAFPATAQVFDAPPAPLAPQGTIDSRQPAFSWTPAPRTTGEDGDTTYELYLWNSFSGEVVLEAGIPAPSYDLAPRRVDLGVEYVWWVRATDRTTGERSEWSSPLRFSHPPDLEPVPLFPVGNVPDDVELAVTWQYDGAIAEPVFDLAVFDAIANNLMSFTGVQSGVEPPAGSLAPGRCYRWWVRARDPHSTSASDWSEPLDFCFLLHGGAVPVPLSPSGGIGGTAGGPYTPTFTWSYAPADADTRYDLYIQARGNGLVIVKENLEGTSYTVGPEDALPTDVSLLFWVRARDLRGGGVSEWSVAKDFNTLDVPTVEEVVAETAPTESQAHPLFRFTHPNYLHIFNIAYDLHIYNPATGETHTELDFDGTYLDEDTREHVLTSSLKAGYTYSYCLRMRYRIFETEGAWSAPASFSIPLYGGEVPVLVEPVGTPANPADPIFSWSFAGGTADTRFDLYVDDLTEGRIVFSGTTAAEGTSFSASSLGLELVEGHTYQWWARSRDGVGGGVGPWSEAATFTD